MLSETWILQSPAKVYVDMATGLKEPLLTVACRNLCAHCVYTLNNGQSRICNVIGLQKISTEHEQRWHGYAGLPCSQLLEQLWEYVHRRGADLS